MGLGTLRTWSTTTDSARRRPSRGAWTSDAEPDAPPEPKSRRPRCRPTVVLLAPVLLAVAASLSAPARAAAPEPAPAPEMAAEAERTYLADCASCHGDEGRGTNRGPSIVDVGNASTYYYLSTGRMPIDEPDDKVTRRDPAYSPQLIEALVEHVDRFGAGGPDVPHVALEAADVAVGGKLYRAQCASCHTTAGGGGALLREDAPPVYHAAPVETAAAIRAGPGTMPAFGEAALSEEELNDVVAYVDYLTQPNDRGGQPLWHLGPLIEGLAAWVLGLGSLVLLALWIGKPA